MLLHRFVRISGVSPFRRPVPFLALRLPLPSDKDQKRVILQRYLPVLLQYFSGGVGAYVAPVAYRYPDKLD